MYAIGISAAALCKNRTLRHMPSGSKTGRYFHGICWDIARLSEMTGLDNSGQGKRNRESELFFAETKKETIGILTGLAVKFTRRGPSVDKLVFDFYTEIERP